MTDQTIGFKFGATTAGFDAGAAGVKGALSGIQAAVARLGAAFAQLGSQAAAGAATAKASLVAVGQGAKEAAEGVEHMLGPIQLMRDALSGVGEALMAAFAVREIADFADKMGEAAEAAYHTALTFGMTTAEVQRMKAEAAGLGIPFEAFTAAMMRSSRALTLAREGSKRAEETFKTLGINIKDAVNPAELMQQAIAGLAGVQDVPTRIGLAMQLFGRNIQAIAPLINVTKEQIATLNEEITKSGAVSDDAEAKALALAEAQNMNKVAMMGLSNVLASSFAPLLTQIVQGLTGMVTGFNESYAAGGAAKTVMDGLVDTLKLMETGFVAVYDINKIAATALIDFGRVGVDAIVAVWDVVKGLWGALMDLLAPAFKWVGDVATAAWKAIQAGWDFLVAGVKVGIEQWEVDNAGLVQVIGMIAGAFGAVGKIVVDVITTIIGWVGKMASAVGSFLSSLPGVGGAFAKVGADGKKAFSDITSQAAAAKAAFDKIWGPGAKAVLPKGAGLGPVPDLGGGAKKKKGSDSDAGNESDMQALQEKFDQEENAHNDMITNMQADELAYWSKVKTNIQGGALSEKDAATVRMKVESLTHQVAIQGIRDEIAARRDADTAAISDLQNEATREKNAIAEKIKAVQDAEKDGLLSHAAATAQILQLIQEEKKAAIDAANAIEAIKVAADEFIKTKSAEGTAEYKQAQKDEVDAARAAAAAKVSANDTADDQIDARNRQTADQANALGHSWVDPVVGAWTSGLKSMESGTGSFRQTVANMFDALIGTIIDKIGAMVAKWLVSHIFMRGVAATTSAADVAIHTGAEAAKTGATVAGTTTRAAAEVSSNFIVRAIKAVMLFLHIGHEAAKTTATAVGSAARATAETTATIAAAAAQKVVALTQLATLIGLAGAGGVASMAAAPFPIDLGAPEFGASMAAAAGAYGAIISAAGGWGEVPQDQLALVHKREMILPADIATPLRTALAGGGTAGATLGATIAGASSARTENHSFANTLNYQPSITGTDSPDIIEAIEAQSTDFVRLMKSLLRGQRFN